MIWALAILGTVAYANPLPIERDGSRIFLAAETCADGQATARELAQWAENLGEKAKCQPVTEGLAAGCRVEISSCLPKTARDYLGKQDLSPGANCWNAALTAKGILPALRHVEFDEWNYFLQPPLCRQLAESEAPRAGDLGAIRTKGAVREELHGFLYASPQLAYNKDDGTAQSAYGLVPVEEVLGLRGVGQGAEIINYRCLSLPEFLAKADLGRELKRNLQTAGKLEECVAAQPQEPLSVEAKGAIETTVRALALYVKNEEAKPSASGDFALGMLKFRLHGLVNQLQFMGEPELQMRLAELLPQ